MHGWLNNTLRMNGRPALLFLHKNNNEHFTTFFLLALHRTELPIKGKEKRKEENGQTYLQKSCMQHHL